MVSPRSPQIPNHSLPWYKVVELVRTEDLLDFFFYFCLVRMQEWEREKKKIQMRPLSAFPFYCHTRLPVRVTWCGLAPQSMARLHSGALQDDRFGTRTVKENALYHVSIAIDFSKKNESTVSKRMAVLEFSTLAPATQGAEEDGSLLLEKSVLLPVL